MCIVNYLVNVQTYVVCGVFPYIMWYFNVPQKNIKIERPALNFYYNSSVIGGHIFLLDDGTRIWPVSTLVSAFAFLKL